MQRRLKRTASSGNIRQREVLTLIWTTVLITIGITCFIISLCCFFEGKHNKKIKNDLPLLTSNMDFLEWQREWEKAYELDVGEPCGVESDQMDYESPELEYEPCEAQKD